MGPESALIRYRNDPESTRTGPRLDPELPQNGPSEAPQKRPLKNRRSARLTPRSTLGSRVPERRSIDRLRPQVDPESALERLRREARSAPNCPHVEPGTTPNQPRISAEAVPVRPRVDLRTTPARLWAPTRQSDLYALNRSRSKSGRKRLKFGRNLRNLIPAQTLSNKAHNWSKPSKFRWILLRTWSWPTQLVEPNQMLVEIGTNSAEDSAEVVEHGPKYSKPTQLWSKKTNHRIQPEVGPTRLKSIEQPKDGGNKRRSFDSALRRSKAIQHVSNPTPTWWQPQRVWRTPAQIGSKTTQTWSSPAQG